MLAEYDRKILQTKEWLISEELKLPTNFEEEDNSYLYKGEPATLYKLKIVCYLKILESDGNDTLYCFLQYFARGDPSDEFNENHIFVVDVSELDSTRYWKTVLHKQCINVLPGPEATKFLSRSIKLTLADLDPVELPHAKPGHHIFMGIPYFSYGDQTVCFDNSIEFYNDSKDQLKDFSSYNEGFSWLLQYIRYEWTDPVELLADYTSAALHLFEDSDRRFILNLYGKTSIGKTSSACLALDHFKNHVNCASLCSDKNAHYKAVIPGASTLIDNFYKSKSNRNYQSNYGKNVNIVESTQTPANITVKDVEYKHDNIIFLTTEIKPQDKSITNRCILVKKEKPFKEDEMTHLQENIGQCIKLRMDYSQFLVDNEADIRKNMKGYLDICKCDHSEYEGRFKTNPRVQRNKQTLKVVLLIFMKFLRSCSDFSEECLKQIEQRFRDSIEDSIFATYEGLKAEIIAANNLEYVYYLANLCFMTQEVHVTDYIKLFKDSLKSYRKNGHAKYLLFYEKYPDCVCIKGDTLVDLFDKHDGTSRERLKKEIFKNLKNLNVIEYSGKDSSYPIKNHKDLGRFVHLRLDKLKLYYCEEIGLQPGHIEPTLVYDSEADLIEEEDDSSLSDDNPLDFLDYDYKFDDEESENPDIEKPNNDYDTPDFLKSRKKKKPKK